LGDAARAIGMTKIANDAGITREALYQALSERGNPTLDTLFKVLKALGVRISVHA
jgi:probable addiction module antidote protein